MNSKSYSKRMFLAFVPAVWAVIGASKVTATTLPVPSTSYPTIQSAIDAAGTGDTVAVAAGTYTGLGNTDIDFKGKAITVRCTAAEPATCTIDCESLWRRRGFYFHSGEGANSVVDGFTIINGKGNQGGAISCESASPTITNCKFTENESTIREGGAIYCSNASPTISNCEFSNNYSPYDGGAIYCTNSSPTITKCSFSENTAKFYGGAVFCETSSNATITDCTFTSNSANFGAGIACMSSSPTISNCTFETNTASYHGGGIYCTAASPDVSGCTLTGNSATREGGGIYCEESSAPIISNCDINTNSSHGNGGGIYSTLSTPTVSGCDLVGNTANSGAGIFSDRSPMTIENCTISSNVAGPATFTQQGGGIYISFDSPTISGSTISGNSAYDGGGIYLYYAFPTVVGTHFSGNTAVRYGGGINGDDSWASFGSCVIQGNDAQYGGGIYIEGESVSGNTSMINSIIVENTADYGAGTYIYSSSPVFINNTITKNVARTDPSGGGGVYYYSTTRRPELINTIFWGNSPDEIQDTGPILVQYSIVEGGYAGAGGTGIIDSDPMFVDFGINDFQLTSGSPCIDAATSLYAPEVDYDGTARWDDPDTPNTGAGDDPYYDIGAFEYYPRCAGDSEPDGDVDGSDLSAVIAGTLAIDLDDFAAEFGRANCAM